MRILSGIEQRFRLFKKKRRIQKARTELASRVEQSRPWLAKPHGLSRRLVVSLTSFPKRFDTLALTLQCLLFQTVRPDSVQLWIAREDIGQLPVDVINLQALGLQILTCEDLRSYKKIIPALSQDPESLIVTADDDLYYWPSWLEELVEAYRETGNPVIAHRAHKIVLRLDGTPEAYVNWERPVRHRQSGPLIFPTGAHGVLYDSKEFHPDVGRKDLFMSLCPNADDVWLYWMHRRRRSRPLCLSLNNRIVEWPGSQIVQLQADNLSGGGNDRAIRALITEFGFPRD